MRLSHALALACLIGSVTFAVTARSEDATPNDTGWHLFVDITGVFAGRYEVIAEPPYKDQADCEADLADPDTAQDLTALLHMAKHMDPGAGLKNIRCEQGAGNPI